MVTYMVHLGCGDHLRGVFKLKHARQGIRKIHELRNAEKQTQILDGTLDTVEWIPAEDLWLGCVQSWLPRGT